MGNLFPRRINPLQSDLALIPEMDTFSAPKRSVIGPNEVTSKNLVEVEKCQLIGAKKTLNQWLTLVPLKGGRDYITPQKAIYKWYISGIYCQLGDYIIPTTF